MLKIAMSGYGKMGQLIIQQINQDAELSLVGIISAKEASQGVADVEKLPSIPNIIIDFSHISRLDKILSYALEHKIALVIGTTGYEQEQLDKITFASQHIPILLASNTSFGIFILNKLLQNIIPYFSNQGEIEIIEQHHKHKLDAPSGTAQSILNTIQKSRNQEYEIKFGRKGHALRTANEIGIHSIRAGNIYGQHSIICALDDDIIEIKHQALSKNIFAVGAIKGAKFIHNKLAGLYSMEDVYE
ncbi:MAG: 4-hydroxy-tetrahydrodipicolinate reductase [Sediminibacterium sp.]|nr:4-hydroxy-tetrahydrodipicolinate reductase [Sediminibacterium sp.]